MPHDPMIGGLGRQVRPALLELGVLAAGEQ